MSNEKDFRALLIKIQDLLSDNDRQRLHFLLGDDVPRYLRDDPSMGGALQVLQSLIDKAIITDEDSRYLIEAFRKIHCDNAARKLEEYQRLRNSDSANEFSLERILSDHHEYDKVLSTDKFASQIGQNFENNQPKVKKSMQNEKIIYQSKELFARKITKRKWTLLVLIVVCVLFLILLIVFMKIWSNISMENQGKTCFASCTNLTWSKNGSIISSGFSASNKISQYTGISIGESQEVLIADSTLERLQKITWKSSSAFAIYSDEHNSSSGSMGSPSDVIMDKEDKDSLIYCDRKNMRVARWSTLTNQFDETIIKNIACLGVAMGEKGYLFVSDTANNVVRRFRVGERNRTIVAGNESPGSQLNQLNRPTYIAVDKKNTIYVSDSDNHRIVKWVADANEGILVAGGRGKGNSLAQLSDPRGIAVDIHGNIYVVDRGNHRVMRWCNGDIQGTIIAGTGYAGSLPNELNNPTAIAIDIDNNIFVTDTDNQRVLSYQIK